MERKWILTMIVLLNTVSVLASSNSGRFFTGLYSIIMIGFGAIFGYALMIGFSENMKHKDSENDSLGCGIIVCALAVIGGFIALAKSCS